MLAKFCYSNLFAGKYLWKRCFLGSSDVADVRYDSMPQSSHSCGGLSHTKGDDDYCDDHDFDDYDADIESDDDKEEHLKIQFCQCLGVRQQMS